MIAEKVGLSRSGLANVVQKFSAKEKDIRDAFEDGKSVEEIAEYYGLDIPTTWSIVLDGVLRSASLEKLPQIARILMALAQ